MEIRTPLFKGATRPACVWGIPLKPFCGCMGFFILLAFWFYIPLLLGAIPCLFIMHRISAEDDQRFHQLFLKMRINMIGAGNKKHWGSIVSIAPASYRDHKNKR